MNSESGETVGPEVSWVGPRHEGWEAQQSCLGLMRWQQGATGNQEGPEATATPGEDDSAVLERRSGGHGLEMAGARQVPGGGVYPRESSPLGLRGGMGRGMRCGVFRLWWRMTLRDKGQGRAYSIADCFETPSKVTSHLCSLLSKVFLWPVGLGPNPSS